MTWLSVNNGRTGVILLHCYLPSGPAVKDECEDLLSSIFEFASTLGSTPVLLTGYFELSGQGNGLIVTPSLEQLYSSLPVEATFSALSGHV